MAWALQANMEDEETAGSKKANLFSRNSVEGFTQALLVFAQ